jgi:hypothetical protein
MEGGGSEEKEKAGGRGPKRLFEGGWRERRAREKEKAGKQNLCIQLFGIFPNFSGDLFPASGTKEK